MAGNGDFKAHEETFSGVMNMLKWGTVATVIIVAFVVFLIAS
jgi:Bacterial aa3 type cytochrome c oxidase subunit IV